MDKKQKLMIIGIDGASFNLVSEYMRSGLLPNLKELASQGSFNRLISTMPPITPVAWTTMMTGCNPGKHGIYYFVQGAPDSPYMANNFHVKVPTIWELLGKTGIQCGLFNIPWTFPPLCSTRFCISGMDCPKYDERMFNPSNLFHELKENVGKYSLNAVAFHGGKYNIKELYKQVNLYTDTARYLLKKYWKELDIFMMVFMQVDHVQHKFWEFGPVVSSKGRIIEDVVKETYQLIDSKVGELLNAYCNEDTHVMIVSDHGFTGSKGTLRINKWLADLGLLNFSASENDGNISHRKIYMALRKIFQMMPESVKNFFRRNWWMPSRRREVLISSSSKTINWENTKAFCSAEFGGISLNLKSKYKKGIVNEKEVEGVINLIEKSAQNIIDPMSGRPIVEKVWHKEELFNGPYTGELPDLWIQSKGYEYYLELGWLGREIKSSQGTFTEPAKGHGTHHPEGIFILKGKKIKNLEESLEIYMQDIAPTVMYLMGFDSPAYMDGKARTELFHEPVPVKMEKIQYSIDSKESSPKLSREDQSLIEERLKSLGYL